MSSRLALAVAIAAGIVSRAWAASSDPAEDLRRFDTLRVGASSAPVRDLVLSCGRVTMTLKSGSVAPIRAGGEVVGLFFEGAGALEYRSEDPVEFPAAERQNRKSAGLAVEKTGKALVFRDTFEHLTWLASGKPLPELPGGTGMWSPAESRQSETSSAAPSLEAAFRKSSEKTHRIRGAPLSHLFTLQRANAPQESLVVAQVEGGKEDLRYVFDAFEGRSESLFALRHPDFGDAEMRRNLDPIVLSDQPIGRDRRDPLSPSLVLADARVDLTASDGKDAELVVDETLFPQRQTARALRLDLLSVSYARTGALVVVLAEPAPVEQPLKLRFQIEGDYLVRPGGDNFWMLGTEPWFPQPGLYGQYYTFHARVKVRKPFIAFAPGRTVARGSEGDYNTVETDVDKPVQFAVILGGRYEFDEETRKGITVRVASYAGKNSRAIKQLTNLAFGIIEYYQNFLGPFPFSEFNILEINSYGFGQAPPATMFITREAFTPYIGEANQFFSNGLNERFAHEIAHQYWGHVVKMPSEEEQWLTESFAEYSAAIFLRDFKGKSSYESLLAIWKSRASDSTSVAPMKSITGASKCPDLGLRENAVTLPDRNQSEVPVKRAAALVFLAALLTPSLPGTAESLYKLPPKEVVQAVDATAFPEALASPARDAVLLLDLEAYPPISLLARPMLRIGGIRIDPAMGTRRRVRRATGISIQRYDGSPALRVALPDGARIGAALWSRDGKRFAFARDLDAGVELWMGDSATGAARAVPGVRLNDVLTRPFTWTSDGRLLAWTIPAGRAAAPAGAAVPAGPIVEETAGKRSQMATFEDLIRDSHDEDLFEHFATAQLAVVDPASGQAAPLGAPGMYVGADFSPDGHWLLVARVKRPFSSRVPFSLFSRSTEIWVASGRKVATVADLPVSDEVPRQGVPIGPRSIEWQPLRPASLVWVEALDGGDPIRKVPNRDRILRFDAPFDAVPQEIRLVQFRYAGIVWSARPDVALLSEFDRERRWETTRLVDLAARSDPGKIFFDRSVNDAYKDPGAPVMQLTASGERVLLQDGDWIYFSGNGATEAGDRPFLDRRNLSSGASERLFRSEETAYELFVSFAWASAGPGRSSIVTRRETPSDPPNFYVLDWRTGKRHRLTDFRDPAPALSRVKKELVRYARKDGVPLSGTLYLPPDWKPGTRLPAIVWAYPLEYSDSGTAGQVRGSTRTFTRPTAPSPIFFALHGYAVLNDATMPVVGDPETVNNTYLEQIADAARAAVDKLDAMGVADKNRIVIGGHSYGAFMTANLLAHTDIFAAGIARSGAYNRSLTPFGFQTERRSYWEATDLYTKISPFTNAHKIRKPILLIHGEADDNTGTFPIQTERFFQAIKGNGGTARLVLLPEETHGYRARESVLDVLAEMFEWADRWTKPVGAMPAPAANR